jgi:urease alpha subunit
MVHREILIPDKENHSIEMPEQFFGKKVEVIVMDIATNATSDKFPALPTGKVVSMNDLFADFGAAPDFPPYPSK